MTPLRDYLRQTYGGFADRRHQDHPIKIDHGDENSSRMSRQAWIEHWFRQPWLSSKRKTKNANIDGYNVLYMPDHNDPDVWTYRIAPEGSSGGQNDQWSYKKYCTAEQAKQAALERLADILGKK